MIGDFTYINIPNMNVGKQKDIDSYANWIYDSVIKLHENKTKGWIIDLKD